MLRAFGVRTGRKLDVARGHGGALDVVIVTTFYPNSADPARAVFVENLALELRAECRVHVVSPLPWAPPTRRWAAWRAVAHIERRKGLAIVHPRFLVLPRLEIFNGLTYAFSVLRVLARFAKRYPRLVIHAHCAYPDAVGVGIAARLLGLPYAVTAHGSDLNIYSYRASLRPQIRWALRGAGRVMAVSSGLRRRVLELVGVSAAARCQHVACAAVDPAVFNTRAERAALRRSLGLPDDASIVVFIGKLVPVKGVDVLLSAWSQLGKNGTLGAEDQLLVIGAGPLDAPLREAARDCVRPVRFLGAQSQTTLALWLRAADLLCLPSHSEGTPNVVIEALASGTPVIASSVGAVPELVCDGVTGFLATPGDAVSLEKALARGLAHRWDETTIAASVSKSTWRNIASATAQVLQAAAEEQR